MRMDFIVVEDSFVELHWLHILNLLNGEHIHLLRTTACAMLTASLGRRASDMCAGLSGLAG